MRKLLVYILERRPDEFGLVLDEQGSVRMKDLLMAIQEEPGWGYVKKSHILEVLMTSGGTSFVVRQDRIAAVDHDLSLSSGEETPPPKLLYHCIRRRAYRVVREHGIGPAGTRRVFLATSKALATRMGKRRDPKPVLLTVQANKAFKAGIRFHRYGEFIFGTDHLPAGYFTGPTPPREKKKENAERKTGPVAAPEKHPGSVTFDPDRSEALFRQSQRKKGAKKKIGWKQELRRSKHERRKPQGE